MQLFILFLESFKAASLLQILQDSLLQDAFKGQKEERQEWASYPNR